MINILYKTYICTLYEQKKILILYILYIFMDVETFICYLLLSIILAE